MKKQDFANISLEEILEQAPGNVYWKDLNGVRRGCNQANLDCFAINADNWLGKSDYDIFPEEEAVAMVAIEQEIIRSGKTQTVEEVSTRQNGETGLFLSRKSPLKNKLGETVGIVGVSLDITKAKAEEMRRLHLLESIINLMPAHVYWKDSDGNYLDCNQSQATALGLTSKEEIRQHKPYSRLPEAIAKTQIEQDNKVLQSGQTTTLEEQGVRDNGEIGLFLTKKTPLYDEQQNISGLLGISFDITEKRQQELAVEQAKNQVYQMAKQVAHDLNNFVFGLDTCIKNDTSISTATREKIAGFLNDINLMSERLLKQNKATNELLGSGSQTQQVGQTTSAAEVLQRAIHIASFKAQAMGIRLISQVKASYPAFVHADATELKRIFLNLINNGLEAKPKSKELHLNCELSNNKLSISICDDGDGIPAAVLAQLGLTEITHGKENGHGIGIYHATNLLNNWGASLSFESIEGQGTKAIIELPLIKQPVWFTDSISIPKQLVIVDDNQAIHEQWQTLLEQGGLSGQLQHCYNPHELEEWLQHNNKENTLFLIDQQYLGSDQTGAELICKHQLNQQSILVTAVSTDDPSLISNCLRNKIRLLSKQCIELVPLLSS